MKILRQSLINVVFAFLKQLEDKADFILYFSFVIKVQEKTKINNMSSQYCLTSRPCVGLTTTSQMVPVEE